MSTLIQSSVWNFCHWVADVPPDETSPAARSKEKRLYSQARLSKMADSRSKNINTNRKKSVKKNRNPIRLCILPFYTIIFTLQKRPNSCLVKPKPQNHKSCQRTAHYMAEASLLSFPFPSCPARFLLLSLQPPCDTKRPLWWRELWSHFIIVGFIYHCCRYYLCNLRLQHVYHWPGIVQPLTTQLAVQAMCPVWLTPDKCWGREATDWRALTNLCCSPVHSWTCVCNFVCKQFMASILPQLNFQPL